jgi:hypothetical protein
LIGKREPKLVRGLFASERGHGSFVIEYGYGQHYLQLFGLKIPGVENYVIQDPNQTISPLFFASTSIRTSYWNYNQVAQDSPPFKISVPQTTGPILTNVYKLTVRVGGKNDNGFCQNHGDPKCWVVQIKTAAHPTDAEAWTWDFMPDGTYYRWNQYTSMSFSGHIRMDIHFNHVLLDPDDSNCQTLLNLQHKETEFRKIDYDGTTTECLPKQIRTRFNESKSQKIKIVKPEDLTKHKFVIVTKVFDGFIAYIVLPGVDSLSDHRFLFGKLEQIQSGQMEINGNFIGNGSFGIFKISLSDNTDIILSLIFYSEVLSIDYTVEDPDNHLGLQMKTDLVALAIRYEDQTIQDVIIQDPTNSLQLGENITALTECTACWQPADYEDSSNWNGHANYKPLEIIGKRPVAEATTVGAFTLNLPNNRCDLSCDTSNYWHTFYRDSENELMQACIPYNCKKLDNNSDGFD